MAQININVPDAMVPRLRTAFGRHLRLGRDATAGEIKDALIEFAHTVVHDTEAVKAKADAQAAVEATARIDIT